MTVLTHTLPITLQQARKARRLSQLELWNVWRFNRGGQWLAATLMPAMAAGLAQTAQINPIAAVRLGVRLVNHG